MEIIYLFCCLIIVIGIVALIGFALRGDRKDRNGPKAVRDTQIGFTPAQKDALLRALSYAYSAKDPKAAVGVIGKQLEQVGWIPAHGHLPGIEPAMPLTPSAVAPQAAPPPAPVPAPTGGAARPVAPPLPPAAAPLIQERPPAASPVTASVVAPVAAMRVTETKPRARATIYEQPVRTATPSTPFLSTSRPTSPPPVPSAPPFTLPDWMRLDNITLLLYLGAALMVIAAGVFVGSSWDAISGLARFGIVFGFALAFLGTGEAFVRRSRVLQRAGNTFRTLGLVLLPFCALAYDRFVLNGTSPANFWFPTGLALALLYYFYYRFAQPGWLAALLATISAGIFTAALPGAFGLGDEWRIPASLLLGATFLLVAWRVRPDGRRLLRQFLREGGSPLAESHLLAGSLATVAGLFLLVPAFPSNAVSFTSYLLLALISTGVALWLNVGLLAGAGATFGGLAMNALVALIAPGQFGAVALGQVLYGVVVYGIAAHAQQRLWYGRIILTLMGIGWVVWARSTLVIGGAFGAIPPVWIEAAAVAGYIGLFLALAGRYRNGLTLAVAWVVLHITIFDTLITFFDNTDPTLTVPIILALVLAGLWLAAEQVSLPRWASRFGTMAFVAEAVVISVLAFTNLAVTSPASFSPSTLTGAMAVGLVTAGWWWLSYRWRGATAPSNLFYLFGLGQSLLTAFITVVYRDASLRELAVSFYLLATFSVIVAPYIWAHVRNSAVTAGLLLALFSIPVGVSQSSELGQLLLAMTILLFGWSVYYYRRAFAPLELATAALVYLLVGWLAWDTLQPPLIPFVALGLGIVLFPTALRALPANSILLRGVALGTVTVAPYIGAVWSPVWGDWVMAQSLMAGTALSQLTLVGSILFYGWVVARYRQDTPALELVATALVYSLVGWVVWDYVAPPFAPLFALALGSVVFRTASRALSVNAPLLRGAGLVTATVAPFMGIVWRAVWQDAVTPQGVIDGQLVSQLTLTGTMLFYGWVLPRYRRTMPYLELVTATLAYVLVGWVVTDYVAVQLAPVAALGLGIVVFLASRRALPTNIVLLQGVGLFTATIAPFMGLVWPPIWRTLAVGQSDFPGPLFSQIALMGTTLFYGWLITRYRQTMPWLELVATALAYVLVGWLVWDYVAPQFAPFAAVAVGIALFFAASRALSLNFAVLRGVALLTVAFAPFMGIVWPAAWQPLPVGQVLVEGDVFSQIALLGTTLFYGWLITRYRQAMPYLELATTLLVYLLVGWVAFDHLAAPLTPFPLLALGTVLFFMARRALPANSVILRTVANGTLLLAPFAGIVSGAAGAGSRLQGITEAQIALFLVVAFFGGYGVQQRDKNYVTLAGVLLYGLYAWVLRDNDITTLQLYSVPLAILLFGLSWLHARARVGLEAASLVALLVPAAAQTVEARLLYSLLLGGWGLLSLAVGIGLQRRLLTVGGTVALLIAAVRQLWQVVAQLPPALIIGVVGLTLIIVAVVLTLRRDALMELGRRLTEGQ